VLVSVNPHCYLSQRGCPRCLRETFMHPIWPTGISCSCHFLCCFGRGYPVVNRMPVKRWGKVRGCREQGIPVGGSSLPRSRAYQFIINENHPLVNSRWNQFRQSGTCANRGRNTGKFFASCSSAIHYVPQCKVPGDGHRMSITPPTSRRRVFCIRR